MEVQIISREIIKPLSPTPDHLRTYKLCVFDQLAPSFYIPILLFYSSGDENPRITDSHRLKKSLSKALTHFYPLSGRIKDDLTIDCNDDGASFIEARVDVDMSVMLDEPKIEVLQQLLPCNPLLIQSSADQVLLAVQVIYFACGGLGLGVCVSHVVADTSTAARFLKSWADVACGADKSEDVVYDCSSMFPPRDLSNFNELSCLVDQANYVELPEDKIVTNRFLFDGHKIAALVNETKDNEPNSYRPTRIEALTALIWEALIATTTQRNDFSPIFTIAKAVDLRKRLTPQISQQCIGNVSFSTMISTSNSLIENRIGLASKIHESIKELDDECKRERYMGSGEWLDDLVKKACEEMKNESKLGMFFFSSWCRIPFYEIDFGWGKPVCVRCGLKIYRLGCFSDSSDGEGIEAWITLSEEEMVRFEQQPGILAYSVFKPNI